METTQLFIAIGVLLIVIAYVRKFSWQVDEKE